MANKEKKEKETVAAEETAEKAPSREEELLAEIEKLNAEIKERDDKREMDRIRKDY